MTDHKCTAQTWAYAIASMIKDAEKDGWDVRTDYNGSLVIAEPDTDDNGRNAKVDW